MSATPPGACLTEAQTHRVAAGEDLGAEVSRHVASCAACAERVSTAAEDEAFLGRMRSLATPGLAPRGAPHIPGYRVREVVSSGAQGVVYRAVQESTSRTVAVKTVGFNDGVGPGDSRRRVRAEREAEIAARLRHPNIVTVYESRTLSDGRIAVVMEYIDGVPLDRWIPPGETPAARQRALLGVFVAVCSAVHHAHLNGVIHRDLKPDNILVTPEGRPVVLDFGIAKTEAIGATATGEFAGTPAYASPEQSSGKPDEVDALTDVYSLGVILYRLLCHTMPYELQGSILEIARTIAEVEPTPPRRHEPLLSPDLEAITMRALRKDKPRRYQSAAGLGRDIERYLTGAPVDARSGSGWYMLRKAVSLNRGRLAWSGALVALALASGATLWLSVAKQREAERRAAAQREQARAEAVRARAVSELLREALPTTDGPSPGLGGVIGSGLGRLYLRLETHAYADDPDLDLTLRKMWGGMYSGLGAGKSAGLIEYAEVSLRNGLIRLRTTHGPEHPDIADALHELADVLLVRRRPAEAERCAREALEMRERLLGPRSARAAESRALLARALFAARRIPEAEREAAAAHTMLVALISPTGGGGPQAEVAAASMTALRARIVLAAGQAGDYAEAERMLREALSVRLRRLPPEHPEVIESLADVAALADRSGTASGGLVATVAAAWGCEPSGVASALRADIPLLASQDRGRFLRVIRAGRPAALLRLLRLHETLLGAEEPSRVSLLIALMRSADAERMPKIKVDAALDCADLLARRFGPSDMAVQLCIDEAATVLALNGDAERAIALAQRSCAIWESMPAAARDPLLAINAERRLGLYLNIAGRHAEAAESLARAAREFGALLGDRHHTVAQARAILGLSLAEMGDLRAGDTLTLEGFTAALLSPATPADTFANIAYARGRTLWLLGRDDEARDALQQAWSPIYQTIHPGFVWRRTLTETMAEIARRAGDEPAADAWRRARDHDFALDPAK